MPSVIANLSWEGNRVNELPLKTTQMSSPICLVITRDECYTTRPLMRVNKVDSFIQQRLQPRALRATQNDHITNK